MLSFTSWTASARSPWFPRRARKPWSLSMRREDFFGEGCLTSHPRRLATVTAIAESEIMRLDKATMVRMLHDEPKFSELFISHLLARNVRVEADLIDQLFNSSEKRLARLLLLMANFGKEGRHEHVIAKVSQEMLAEMVGTTRSRVSFFMNKFRKLGFIDYNGAGLEVHSSLLNMVLHETPGVKVPMTVDRAVSNFDQFFSGFPLTYPSSPITRRQSPRLAGGWVCWRWSFPPGAVLNALRRTAAPSGSASSALTGQTGENHD